MVPVSVGLFGSADFSRRCGAMIARVHPGVAVHTGTLAEVWTTVLTSRPNVLIFEIGIQYTERHHTALRRVLSQLRERFGTEIAIVTVLAAPERFFFGGDLLFAETGDLTPSGLVDSFITYPPGGGLIGSDPADDLRDLVELYAAEFKRRAGGHPPLPPLNSPGWVQTLADPQSRALWMRWLPRYAGYTNENPIIIGETGTGKTNLAYALHRFSGRPGQFVSITPRDFSSSELVQAELFGAVAGAYTGAVDKWGLVKRAEQGTLFIDELQSIDKDLQGKLITFIENKAYRRVGSADSVSADVRFVFASNRSLEDMMATDTLRHDFAYRLERVQLPLQPLHERRLDIAAALAYALAKVSRQRATASPITGFAPAAYRKLFCQQWPGNLRQLENGVARLCEGADIDQRSMIEEQDVHRLIQSRPQHNAATSPEIIAQAAATTAIEALTPGISSLRAGVEHFVAAARRAALTAAAGDPVRAAELVDEPEELMRLFSTAAAPARTGAAHKRNPG